MIVKDVIVHHDIPFDEYLKLPGYSHSFLKRETHGVLPEFAPTDKVRFGSLVDEILTDPENVDITNPNYLVAREVAGELYKMIGEGFFCLQKQLSFTGTLTDGTFEMPVKGRLDLFGIQRVFDIKVTDASIKDLDVLIEFMGYKNQMYLYCKGLGVTKAVLIFYSRKDKKCAFKHFDFSKDFEKPEKFYNDKLLKFGI